MKRRPVLKDITLDIRDLIWGYQYSWWNGFGVNPSSAHSSSLWCGSRSGLPAMMLGYDLDPACVNVAWTNVLFSGTVKRRICVEINRQQMKKSLKLVDCPSWWIYPKKFKDGMIPDWTWWSQCAGRTTSTSRAPSHEVQLILDDSTSGGWYQTDSLIRQERQP